MLKKRRGATLAQSSYTQGLLYTGVLQKQAHEKGLILVLGCM